ncbi:hypothetical protein HONESTABE_214 [Bacillus phage HonestAbe]|nr:hypothetical protein HONESTABE_214 [Bacillus phage HonestAbe]
MMYADIPPAGAMRTISTIHRNALDEKLSRGMREAIVNEINDAAGKGNTATIIHAENCNVLEPMRMFFFRYEEFKYILDEFRTRGYVVGYTPSLESKLVGGLDTPPSISISWDEVNLEKGDDK